MSLKSKHYQQETAQTSIIIIRRYKEYYVVTYNNCHVSKLEFFLKDNIQRLNVKRYYNIYV